KAGKPDTLRRSLAVAALLLAGRRLQVGQPARELRARSNAELRVCPRQRLLDGVHRDEQLSRDLAVRPAGDNKVRNALLARRQGAGGGWAAADAVELRACPLRPQRGRDGVEDSERALERLARGPSLLRTAADDPENEQRSALLERFRRRRQHD